MIDMVAKSKPQSKEPAVKLAAHRCNKNAEFKRIKVVAERSGRVLFGNGHEEDGLLFMLRSHIAQHETIVSDIKDIKEKLSVVSEVNKELDIERQVDIRVKKQLQQLKQKNEEEDDKKIKKSSFNWTKFSIIVGALGIVIMAYFQYQNYQLNMIMKTVTETTKQGVENLGVPTVVNKRSGEFVDLPEDYALKMYPQDFTGTDTVKTETNTSK